MVNCLDVSFLGGVCEVGRSCVFLKSEDTGILLDCGIKQGERSQYPSLEMIDSVDAVILTHAHIDHSGALPLLFSMNKCSSDFVGIVGSFSR